MKDSRLATRSHALPLYFQLKEIIREMIRRQEWLPGNALPSEREFVEQYGMSRMTVRQALSELVNEGIVYREQGKGTFVKRPPPSRAVAPSLWLH